MRALAESLLELVSTGWGPLVLVTHAFFEAFILPVAHDLFLIPICLAKPHLSLVYALMSTTASTLGICVGYGIGLWGGHPILQKIFSKKMLDKAEEYIHKYDFWAIAFACFTPVPVKVFAILAGALELNFKKLAMVAFVFRGLRFFSVSILLFFYGEIAREWILNYLNTIMVVLLVGMVLFYLVWRHIAHKEPPAAESQPE